MNISPDSLLVLIYQAGSRLHFTGVCSCLGVEKEAGHEEGVWFSMVLQMENLMSGLRA